ncbi:MAG: polysaccharide export protein [Deltaproteobacteria bacterium]|nr:polysaccharide export protein [Deltaproteobacteria bacterium]
MKRILLLLMACGLGIWGCATTGRTPKAPTDQQAAVTAPEEYIIGPEDILVISVWKDDTLTTEAVVRSDGKISVPLINDVQASGLTVLQLKDEITKRLKEFVPGVDVTVIVKQMNSNKVYIQGEVTRPGPQDFNGELTVIQALALAGGLTPYAKGSSIIILRADGQKRLFNYNQVIKGKNLKQNIRLRRGDTIIIP